MKNGQKVTYIGKGAYYGYTGIIEDYKGGRNNFTIKSETSRLIITDYSAPIITEHGVTKGKRCDVCRIIPKEIRFDSSELHIVYTCADCNPKDAKLSVLTRILRIIKRIFWEPKGFTA